TSALRWWSADMSANPTTAVLAPRPPSNKLLWLKENLFSSPLNILLTVLVAWLLILAVPAMLDWLFFDADFTSDTAQDCRKAEGACWAFIAEKHRLILFGIYPYEEQWRPLLASLILIAALVCSAIRWFWKPWLVLFWTFALTAVAVLMWGGILGLSYVENARWGGLPLTLILSTFGIAFAFPLGVLLALWRRSHMPAIKSLCVIYIELIRGVPLISLLFMS